MRGWIKGWGRRWWRRLFYCQFNQGCLHAPPNWEMDFPVPLRQNKNDQTLPFPPNPYFCLRLNRQVACCRDWSFLSELRPKQIGLLSSLKQRKHWGDDRPSPEKTSLHRQHTDIQLGKPFLISHGKKPESESALPAPPHKHLSAAQRCKHSHRDNIVWCRTLELNAETRQKATFLLTYVLMRWRQQLC